MYLDCHQGPPWALFSCLTLSRPGRFWTFITFQKFIQTLPNFLILSKNYLEIIRWHWFLFLDFHVAMTTTFWKTCFCKFIIFVFFLMIINFNTATFTFLNVFVLFHCFGKLLKSKMAANWTLWRNCHVMWSHVTYIKT